MRLERNFSMMFKYRRQYKKILVSSENIPDCLPIFPLDNVLLLPFEIASNILKKDTKGFEYSRPIG